MGMKLTTTIGRHTSARFLLSCSTGTTVQGHYWSRKLLNRDDISVVHAGW